MTCLRIRDGWVCEIEYVTHAVEAQRRIRQGERQLYCGMCARWRWPEECEHAGRLTGREFAALERRAKRELSDGQA